MPPQQSDGLLDLVDQLLDFRAHLHLSVGTPRFRRHDPM
jgi:hypothetical protein